MPRFQLNSDDRYDKLDAFTQGYIEAAFFTDTGYPENEDLEDADTSEIAPDALTKVIADCANWQEKNAELLQLAYDRDYEPVQAGRDYWLTRNSHGAGFWEREELEADSLGDKLSDACRYSSVNMYRGDDGLIYFE